MFPRFNVKLGIVFLATFLLLAIPLAFAATESATVSVTVTAAAAIDINPNSFSWSPSGAGVTDSAQYFQVENIGSSDLTGIYAQVTNAADNPYGTGTASNYNAGDFILIDNSTSGTFYYVENKNWNESIPSYVTVPTGWQEGDTGALHGYFVRIRSVGLETAEGEEYFAFTLNGTDGTCSAGTVRIGITPHTKSQTGSTDFSDGSGEYASVSLTSGSGSVSGVNSVFDAHKIVVSSDCRSIALVYWDQSLGGNYLYPGTLSPGAAVDMRIEPKIPYGVVGGSAISGTLTIVA
jgi:hypothetical protein